MILIFDKLLSKQWVYTAGARVIVVCIKSYPRLKYFLKCENIQTSLLFVDKGDVINLRGNVYVLYPLTVYLHYPPHRYPRYPPTPFITPLPILPILPILPFNPIPSHQT